MIGLTYIRQIKGLSMQDVADMIGVTKQTISKWEGGLKPISYSSLKSLSEKLNIQEYIIVKEVDNITKVIILKEEIKRF